MMRDLRYRGLFAVMVFLCGAAAQGGGCLANQMTPIDPSADELAKGNNFDIQRTRGFVTSLGVRYFVGDQTNTTERKGQAYYFVEIQLYESIPHAPPPGSTVVPQQQTESFVGISKEVYDALELNKRLPASPLLVSERLPFLSGRVVDKVANPRENEFYIVVDDGKTMRTYRVTSETFYRDVTLNMELPPVSPSR